MMDDEIITLLKSHDRPAYLMLYGLPYAQRREAMAIHALLIEAEMAHFDSSDALIAQIKLQWWIDTLQAQTEPNHYLAQILYSLPHKDLLVNALRNFQNFAHCQTAIQLGDALQHCYAGFYHCQYLSCGGTPLDTVLQSLTNYATLRGLWRLSLAFAQNKQRLSEVTTAACLEEAYAHHAPLVLQHVPENDLVKLLIAPKIALRSRLSSKKHLPLLIEMLLILQTLCTKLS
ncbi:MAG: squalene/phytoene synthase family protein [Pseudomonadota bacterium]